MCARGLVYACPHATIYVSACRYICVLKLLCVCPQCAPGCVAVYGSSYLYICVRMPLYVSSYYCVCVLSVRPDVLQYCGEFDAVSERFQVRQHTPAASVSMRTYDVCYCSTAASLMRSASGSR